MLNVIYLTRSSITDILSSVAKQSLRPTLFILKSNKVSHASILSNALTAKTIIRQILAYAYSGDTISTKNSTPRNIKKSKTLGTNKFTQL